MRCRNGVELQPIEERKSGGKALCTAEEGVNHRGSKVLQGYLGVGHLEKFKCHFFILTAWSEGKHSCAKRHCIIV